LDTDSVAAAIDWRRVFRLAIGQVSLFDGQSHAFLAVVYAWVREAIPMGPPLGLLAVERSLAEDEDD
jgi:hypothetical protein